MNIIWLIFGILNLAVEITLSYFYSTMSSPGSFGGAIYQFDFSLVILFFFIATTISITIFIAHLFENPLIFRYKVLIFTLIALINYGLIFSLSAYIFPLDTSKKTNEAIIALQAESNFQKVGNLNDTQAFSSIVSNGYILNDRSGYYYKDSQGSNKKLNLLEVGYGQNAAYVSFDKKNIAIISFSDEQKKYIFEIIKSNGDVLLGKINGYGLSDWQVFSQDNNKFIALFNNPESNNANGAFNDYWYVYSVFDINSDKLTFYNKHQFDKFNLWTDSNFGKCKENLRMKTGDSVSYLDFRKKIDGLTPIYLASECF